MRIFRDKLIMGCLLNMIAQSNIQCIINTMKTNYAKGKSLGLGKGSMHYHHRAVFMFEVL
jgi:hypothetical protein